MEGWIVFVSGVHDEAQEDNILDKFCEYGKGKVTYRRVKCVYMWCIESRGVQYLQ